MTQFKNKIENFFGLADIAINGTRSWDIKVNNENFYQKIFSGGSLSLGEAYMDGWWDVPKLDQFFYRIIQSNLEKRGKTFSMLVSSIQARILNMQNIHRSKHVAKNHYDVGNDLFEKMLGKYMMYSCGYWKEAKTLDDAQRDKLEMSCQKLKLEPGMRVLDCGCGWGSTAKYMAENYNVEVVGITLSEEQAKFARKINEGLKVDIKVLDYRHLEDKFDRIISIGMFEHVGFKNFKPFFDVMSKLLKRDGIMLLHTIGGYEDAVKSDPWLDKYIFKGSVIPSPNQITKAINNRFYIEDWHNFGHDYDTTLMAWYKNFDKNWGVIKKGYDDRFYRMWQYYLLLCAASFRARKNQLWQMVLSPRGSHHRYHSLRTIDRSRIKSGESEIITHYEVKRSFLKEVKRI